MNALTAGFWGFVGGASLVVGALLGLYTRASRRLIGLIMAAGAGVLIATVTFELMDEAFRVGGFDASACGLLLGALTFFAADYAVSHFGGAHRKRSHGQPENSSAMALVVGALLDGIPESTAIGISLIHGGAVSWAMVAAVFLSNVPESMSASVGMKKDGRSTRYILLLWSGVVLTSTISALLGYYFLAGASGNIIGGIQAFAAGAILTMLASTMMPEAYDEGGAAVGLVTTLGFLAAFALGRLE